MGDYHDWIADAQAEAAQAGNFERTAFYSLLSRELDADKREPHDKLFDVRELMYKGKNGTMPQHRTTGRRTQQHFDPVMKVRREIHSSESDWDEEEWHIFGERHQETDQQGSASYDGSESTKTEEESTDSSTGSTSPRPMQKAI